MNLSAETLHFIEECSNSCLAGEEVSGCGYGFGCDTNIRQANCRAEDTFVVCIVRIALSPAFVNGTVLVRVDGKV